MVGWPWDTVDPAVSPPQTLDGIEMVVWQWDTVDPAVSPPQTRDGKRLDGMGSPWTNLSTPNALVPPG